MEWKTKITELLECRYPILSGAFAQYDNSDLVTAVSRAGAFGVLTASGFNTEDAFRTVLRRIKKETDNPFGVNYSAGAAIKSDHRFFRYLEIQKEEGNGTVITASSNVQEFVDKVKQYKMKWIHKAAVIRHAVSASRMNPDAIIITGLEGAGLKNPDQNTTFINMINAGKYLSCPVIASGGISSGRAMAAALILGAQAIHMGTAFLATKESPAPDDVKKAIIDQDSFDPSFIRQVYHIDFANNAPPYVLRSMASGQIDSIISAGDLIRKIVSDAEQVLKKVCPSEGIISLL